MTSSELFGNFVIVKGIFHKIASVLLATLVLLSTVSWTVDKHLCMGRVMDVSLFTEAEDCGMELAMEAIDKKASDNHCCDDESFTIIGQDDLKHSSVDLDLEHQMFLVAFAQSYLHLFVPLQDRPVTNAEYPPPIITRDIYILDQVFLI